MKVVIEDQKDLLAWAAARLDTDGWSSDSFACGVVDPADGDKIRAVLVFNAFFGGRCSCHIASDGTRRWATADILTRLSAFIHLGQGVNRISAVIAAANIPAQVAALKIGFQIEGRSRQGADDGTDGIVFSMLRDENPWLRERV